ncbi:hypothetical protein GJS33_03625 [Streptococcus equi subsp. zooepidemicus]|nr:hypothetical protein GJS33_03625 [Streptococcus equi subsp. zooepidemicus]
MILTILITCQCFLLLMTEVNVLKSCEQVLFDKDKKASISYHCSSAPVLTGSSLNDLIEKSKLRCEDKIPFKKVL